MSCRIYTYIVSQLWDTSAPQHLKYHHYSLVHISLTESRPNVFSWAAEVRVRVRRVHSIQLVELSSPISQSVFNNTFALSLSLSLYLTLWLFLYRLSFKGVQKLLRMFQK